MAKVRAVKDGSTLVAFVRSPNEAQAIRHYLRTRFSAPIATQDDLLMHRDIEVQDSQIDPNPLDPTGAA